MLVRFKGSVRILPESKRGGEGKCVSINGSEVIVEKGAISNTFKSHGPGFQTEDSLMGQEEVFRALKDDSLEIILLGGTVCCVAFGSPGSGKSHTLFGHIEKKGPRAPSTPRAGLRSEGLLPRYASHMVPASLTFVEFTSSNSVRCLLTGSNKPIPFTIRDVTTLARLLSRALCSAHPNTTVMAKLQSQTSGGTVLLTELGENSSPFRDIVEMVSDSRDLVYPIEDALQRSPITSFLSPILQSCNYGFGIACLNPISNNYKSVIEDLRFLDKFVRLQAWPIPAVPLSSPVLKTPKKVVTPESAAKAREAQKTRNEIEAVAAQLQEERKLRQHSEDSLRDVKVALVETEHKHSVMAADVRKGEDSRRYLETELETQAALILQLRERVADAENTSSFLVDKTIETEAESVRLESRARRNSDIQIVLNKEASVLASQAEQTKRDFTQLRLECETLRREKEDLQQHCKNVDSRMLDVAAEKAQGDLRIQQQSYEFVNIKKENEDLRKAPQLYEAEITRISKDERTARLQLARAQTQLQKTTRDNKTLQEAISNFRTQINESEALHETREATTRESITEKDREIELEKTAASKEIDILSTQVEQLTSELQNTKNSLTECKAQTKQIKQAADDTIEALSATLSRMAHDNKVLAEEKRQLLSRSGHHRSLLEEIADGE